jgi:hypothetical protein
MAAGLARAHRRLLFEKHDTGKAKVFVDFAYVKTDGEVAKPGSRKPAVADRFSTTLVITDRDTGCLRAVAAPSKKVVSDD